MIIEFPLWNRLLAEAPQDSILMGGAVIDGTCGIPPKDYDIFHRYIPGEPVNLPDSWVMTDIDFNDPAWAEKHNIEYFQGVGELGQQVIGSVYEYLVDKLHKVQLIGVHYHDPKLHFKNFDHSLTLGTYSNKTGLFIHRKALESIDTQTITYIGHNKSDEQKIKSLKRAKAKAARYNHIQWSFAGFE